MVQFCPQKVAPCRILENLKVINAGVITTRPMNVIVSIKSYLDLQIAYIEDTLWIEGA